MKGKNTFILDLHIQQNQEQKKRAKQIRNSKTHPANARVIPAKRKGKKRVYKIYQRPKGLKKKKI